MSVLDHTIQNALNHYAHQAAKVFNADVFFYVGDIAPWNLPQFRGSMENLASRSQNPENLAFFLYTPGGTAEVAEKMAEMIRHHYNEVWFVVPNMAMSAGTILCMSGDKIYMDYSSSLGPIDPQVLNGDELVPALGYLDQVDRMIEKDQTGNLTDAEFALLQNQDLAALRKYELARELSTSLLKDWLVRYKFKNWDTHSSSGEKVTEKEKQERALKIAKTLSDHNKWHSHGRMIGIKTLTDDLRLKIEDYTDDEELKCAIRSYSDIVLECAESRGDDPFFHTYQLQEILPNER